jgi:sugar phosphate isomerase/epimerase
MLGHQYLVVPSLPSETKRSINAWNIWRREPKLVRFQLNVGNMLMGGGDPMVYLNRYQDRIGSFHLKNVVADRTAYTELGAGVFDLRALLAAVPELAKKPCFVEQQGAADELASAKTNFEYVRGLAF